MQLREIYDLAVASGIDADPRGREGVEKDLDRTKKAYDRLDDDKKSLFDEERLSNPYSDTRMLVGEPEQEIRGIIAGIDMEVGEVMLADRLRDKGRPIDLVLSHHPEGKALASLGDVMKMQADIWASRGVPINVGDSLISGRMREVNRRLSPVNHWRAVSAARELEIALMSVHTPTDNLVNTFLTKYFEGADVETPAEIIKKLLELPEYQMAAKEASGPFQMVGDENNRVGRIHVDMTGGTEGPVEAVTKLAEAGVGTIIGMHMDEKLRKTAEEAKINVVIAGHISSDSLGVNLFLDKLEAKGLAITPVSGLFRHSRA